jgi:hypothetical protein
VTRIEKRKLDEIARLAKKYMRAYTVSIETLEEINDPDKEYLLYYHRGYRDCYDGCLKRLREDNLI